MFMGFGVMSFCIYVKCFVDFVWNFGIKGKFVKVCLGSGFC